MTWSDNPGLVLSYLDATDFPEGKLAQQFTLCDNFFHSAYGGSFLNYQWLIAANTPRWTATIPTGWPPTWDPATELSHDNQLTFDGKYAVNTIQPLLGPVRSRQQHVADLVKAVQNSSAWKDCAIIITYDEMAAGGITSRRQSAAMAGGRACAYRLSSYRRLHERDSSITTNTKQFPF